MRRAAALACAALLLVLATSAHAATTTTSSTSVTDGRTTVAAAPPTVATDPNAPTPVPDLQTRPYGFRLTGQDVKPVAARNAKVRKQVKEHPGAFVGVYTKGPGRWQVSWFSPAKKGKPAKEIAQVYVSDATGKVTEAWDRYQIAWTMARGYPGAFGKKVNAPIVWIPLLVVFLLPFVRWRQPWRLLHLDLLVLAGFSVSVYFFNRADVDASVPIVYPLLAYLLLRCLWIGLRSRAERDPAERGQALHLNVPPTWLAIGLIFLVGFRIGLNVTNSNVIDVGYAGVIGGAKVAHGQKLYGTFPKNNERGDTYGPVTYAAYAPAYELFGWSGRWDDLPAAHAAAIFFDMMCLLLCFLLGRRVRGPGTGIAMAYAWAAYPFSLYTLSSNSNDSLVAALLLATLYVASSAPARGALAVLGGLSKFATLALLPLMATYQSTRRRLVTFALAAVAAGVVGMLPIIIGGGSLHTIYERTISYQSHRHSPFSIWGLWGWRSAQKVWEAFAALLALGVAVLPRRRDFTGLVALSAAVVIALQAGVDHWFYLYIVWFAPLVMLADFARYGDPLAEPAAAVTPVKETRAPAAALSPSPA